MRSSPLGGLLLVAATAVFLAAPATLSAQEDGDEASANRVVTITTFQVPSYDRADVMTFMRKYFMPGAQLNPNVLSYRVLAHNWGRDASEMLVIAEYDDIAKIEAECGEPCDTYYDENAAPEEGEEGYEEYQRLLKLFQKYYSHHRDEIYASPLEGSKIEGKMHGAIGIPEEMATGA